MSVTAFPVLARILKDRGLAQSLPGRLALSAAVIDDAGVWILLAAVLALAGGSGGQGMLLTVSGGLGLAVLVWLLRPLYARLLRQPESADLSNAAFAWLLVGLFGCAAFAEWVGLHAVFGAFLFGISLPRQQRLLHTLGQRIEPLAVVLLMPVLFAQAGQLARPEAFSGGSLGLFGLILLVAVSGKMLGCSLGARLAGHGWRDSLAVGSLMNARGLMELVVIKIGHDASLIGDQLFTLLFAMTLVTTFMASPLLSLFHRQRAQRPDSVPQALP
jgi:Kef-type K+ transport system membrane component KefB